MNLTQFVAHFWRISSIELFLQRRLTFFRSNQSMDSNTQLVVCTSYHLQLKMHKCYRSTTWQSLTCPQGTTQAPQRQLRAITRFMQFQDLPQLLNTEWRRNNTYGWVNIAYSGMEVRLVFIAMCFLLILLASFDIGTWIRTIRCISRSLEWHLAF